jgi:hypothetical protein
VGGSIPPHVLAADDVKLDDDALISGGAINAGCDILIGKELKLKNLDIDLEVPLSSRSSRRWFSRQGDPASPSQRW